MRMKSTSNSGHQFSQVPKATIERSRFDRSFGHKTTFDAGYLIPIYVDEALPGDTFNLRMAAFARLATPQKPIMDNMRMETFFFAVPYRLVWANWPQFNGEQTNPDDSTDYIVPQMTSPVGGYAVGSLSDYFGLPVGLVDVSHSALWHRAYNLIYNDWFRDQNLQDRAFLETGDGPDDVVSFPLRRRGKRHDYFTSCLPWPQKGESISIPVVGGVVPVDGFGVPTFQGDFAAGSTVYMSEAIGLQEAQLRYTAGGGLATGTSTMPLAWADTQLSVDLGPGGGITINELRQSFQIQKMLERDARGGTRYTEVIRAHFGVTSPDARLQRPEYLGGSGSPVLISPVAQTSESEGAGSGTPQANLAGIGTVSFQGHGFTKSFTEHCLLIGLVCVRADLTYQQGLERMWSRQTRFDFYWPALAHIGEQAVLSKEIYCTATGGAGPNEDVFGYQERYAEYRYKPSKVTGLFRSGVAGSLDIWHLAQNFTVRPELDAAFIVEDPPIDRVIAVPTEPHFLFDSYTKLTCARPMPVYGVPGLIDHF